MLQYSIELLAQWDRKRRPIPLAGDKPAKHFGKVGLNHLPKVALCLIRDKRENLICFNMQRQKGFIFRGLLVLAPHIGIDWVRHSCVVDGHIATRSSANPPPNATVVEISADEGGREAEGRGTLHTIRKPSPAARFQKTFLLSGMEVSVRPTESPLLHT